MMQTLPIEATPNQRINTTLGEQNVTLNVYQKSTGLYLDILVDQTRIVSGALCRNAVLIKRYAYLGFVGDLAFLDVTGKNEDPVYPGLGTQFALLYFDAADLAAMTGVVG